MADTKYEPCPFCGGMNVSVCERDHLHFVMCGNCTAEGPAMDGVSSEGHAVKEWNRRSSSSVSEGEKPVLPKPKAAANEYFSDEPVYSADEVREIIAADRTRNCEPVYQWRRKPGEIADSTPWYDAETSEEALAHVVNDYYEVRTAYLAATKAAAPADAPKWSAVHTVGDMVRNLLTLDQGAPIFTAFHVTIDGERRCRTRGITISRERVIDGKWIDINRKDAPYTHVIWAKPDERAPAEDAREEVPPLPEPVGLSELEYAQRTPEAWDHDYRSTWQKLQVALANNRQWRAYAKQLREQLTRRATSVPAIPGTGREKGLWHAPGMGEVHSHDHKYMIDCRREIDDPDQDYVADDGLAKRVCAALNAVAQDGAESALKSAETRMDTRFEGGAGLVDAREEEWIETSKRKPKPEQWCIINIRTNYVNAPPNDSVSAARYDGSNWWANGHHLYEPTHWMPFPAAPSHPSEAKAGEDA